MIITGPACHEWGVLGHGNTSDGVMFIGIAPGKHEMATKRPMTGQSGVLMNNMLEACEWHRDKIYTTNLLCYENPDPSLEEILECRPRLLREIDELRPKLIVPLGEKVTTHLFHPTRPFSEVRGMIDYHPPSKAHVLPTYHPAAVLYGKKAGPGIACDIIFDFKKISMFFQDLDAGRVDRKVDYGMVTSLRQAQHLLDTLPKDRPVVLDIETDNRDIDVIDPLTDRLLCFAVSTSNATFVFPAEFARQLKWPLDVQWTGHFFTFDSQAMLEMFGIDLPIVHDTLLLHWMTDERAGRFARHGLKPLSRQYNYSGFYEEEVKKDKAKPRGRRGSHVAELSPEKRHEYNAKDGRYTAWLADRFIPWVKAEGMWDVYQRLVIPFANCAKYMQHHGVPVVGERLADLAVEWIPLLISKTEELQQEVGRLGGDPNINFDSPDQVSHFLFDILRLPGGKKTATGRQSVDKEVLELLADQHPFVERYQDVKHLMHLFGTYVVGIKDDIKRTGRVHPTPILHGTVGGRLAYSNPPINTIPRPFTDSPYGPKLRALFGYPEDDDRCILEFDYKQAELWMALAYSNDPQLREDLRGDIHKIVAAFRYQKQISEVTTFERSEAKKGTFGKIYLIGDDKLSKTIKRPVPEAREFSQAWDRRYHVYIDWTKRYFEEAVRCGAAFSKTGRQRRFPIVLDKGVKNQIINFPIQSTSHDYVIESIVKGYPVLKQEFDAHILLDGHDAVIVECWKHNWKEVAKRMKTIMETPHFAEFGLPSIPVEVKMGSTWGDAKEVEV